MAQQHVSWFSSQSLRLLYIRCNPCHQLDLQVLFLRFSSVTCLRRLLTRFLLLIVVYLEVCDSLLFVKALVEIFQFSSARFINPKLTKCILHCLLSTNEKLKFLFHNSQWSLNYFTPPLLFRYKKLLSCRAFSDTMCMDDLIRMWRDLIQFYNIFI